MTVLTKYNDISPKLDALSKVVVDSVFHVHKELGAGYQEQIYEDAFALELTDRKISFERQKSFEIFYKEKPLPTFFKPDLIVEGQILVELKAVETIHPVHKSQIYAYLKGTNLPLEFLVNFNVPLIKNGIGRYINKNFVSSDLRVKNFLQNRQG
ncbi:MAG: GxxExxY protein [Alphaproteobacteria bacterium]|nr:GxxExxY protein [Alphaproteobacteria bacterium]